MCEMAVLGIEPEPSDPKASQPSTIYIHHSAHKLTTEPLLERPAVINTLVADRMHPDMVLMDTTFMTS